MGILITNRLLRHILAINQNLSLAHIPDSRDGMYQFRLPVAVDTGNADDLTLAHLKVHMIHYIFGVTFSDGFHTEILHLHDHLTGLCLTLFHSEIDLAADHHL